MWGDIKCYVNEVMCTVQLLCLPVHEAPRNVFFANGDVRHESAVLGAPTGCLFRRSIAI